MGRWTRLSIATRPNHPSHPGIHGQLRRVVLTPRRPARTSLRPSPIDLMSGRRRPGQIAARETVRLGNAVTRLSYEQGGVTYLRWVTTSGEPCPYCTELDGGVVGIRGAFALEGETLHPNWSRRAPYGEQPDQPPAAA